MNMNEAQRGQQHVKSRLTMKTRMEDRHMAAAAEVLKTLEKAGTPNDAQLTLMCVVIYLCTRFDQDQYHFVDVIKQNLSLLDRRGVIRTIVNAIHARVTGRKIYVPPAFPYVMTEDS